MWSRRHARRAKSRIGGDVVVLERPIRQGWPATDRSALSMCSLQRGRHAAGRNRERPPLHHRSGGSVPGRDRIGRRCTSRRSKMCFCGKRERHYGSVLCLAVDALAARTGPLLAAEEPGAGRGGFAADFLAGDRFWLGRTAGILFPGHGGVDGDVFRHFLDDLDHRRPARRLPAFDAGFAGARAPAWCWARFWARPPWPGFRA